MKIAAAQIKDASNNLNYNINTHLQMIDLASKQGVKLLVFPEMSLTGYERELAEPLSFTENDKRLNVFKEKAHSNQMLLIVGAPIKRNTTLYIGSFIFFPDGTRSIYTKQFLHDGEEKYFTTSNNNPLIEFQNVKISVAICADINNPIHPLQAAKKKTTLYIASLFFTPSGMANGYETLSSYAKEYAMNVLMANFTGSSYGIEAGGQSGFWNNKGDLIANLTSDEENLLIIEI